MGPQFGYLLVTALASTLYINRKPGTPVRSYSAVLHASIPRWSGAPWLDKSAETRGECGEAGRRGGAGGLREEFEVGCGGFEGFRRDLAALVDCFVAGAGEAGAQGFGAVFFDGAAVGGGEGFEELCAALEAFDTPAAALDAHAVLFGEAGRQPGGVADVVGVDAGAAEAGGNDDFGGGGCHENSLGGTIGGL